MRWLRGLYPLRMRVVPPRCLTVLAASRMQACQYRRTNDLRLPPESRIPRKPRRSDDCADPRPSACQVESDEAEADSAARLGVEARCVARNLSAPPRNAEPWFGAREAGRTETKALAHGTI